MANFFLNDVEYKNLTMRFKQDQLLRSEGPLAQTVSSGLALLLHLKTALGDTTKSPFIVEKLGEPLPNEVITKYLGRYRNPDNVEAQIVNYSNYLVMDVFDQQFILKHVDQSTFEYYGFNNHTETFVELDGEMISYYVNSKGDTTISKRIQ